MSNTFMEDVLGLLEHGGLTPSYFSKVVLVTPAIAARILEQCNSHNRPLYDGRAEFYGNQMQRNQWKRNSAAIGIDRNGQLTNGQHRLRGVVLSGCTVPMIFAFNCDVDSRGTEDCGKNRTEADRLTLSGTEANWRVVAVAKVVRVFPDWIQGVIAIEDLRETIVDYGPEISFAISNTKDHAVITGCVARAAMYIDQPTLARFCEIIKTGIVNNASEGAAAKFFTWMHSKPGQSLRSGGNVHRVRLYRCTQSAIAAFDKGKDLGSICETQANLWPLPKKAKGV